MITDRDILTQFLDSSLEADTIWFDDTLTPLHIAVSKGSRENVDTILDHLTENIREYK